jgi:imidazolonepropionase-like amidohydrolase
VRGVGAIVAGALLVGCAWATLPRETTRGEAGAAVPEATPAERLLLIRGASVMTGAGPTLPRGDVLVRGGRIEAVAASVAAPPGAEVIDATGRWITPGLIDPHSHLGVYPVPFVAAHADGNELSGPLQAALKAGDAFWPGDPAIRAAVAGGVTTVLVLPGSANLIGGRGATLRLRPGLATRDLALPDAPPAIKLACGENPKRLYGIERKVAPTTRMAEVALLRRELDRARAWNAKTPDPKAEREADKEALASVLRGETLIQNHCYRADEMLLRLEVFGEFGTRPRAFHHAVEAYKIRDVLAREGVGAVVWADWWGIKFELLDATPLNAALLEQAGVRVALHSDSPYDGQRLNQEAAKAMAAGLRAGIAITREQALRWITANPAWVLGIDERTGTLEPGKDADLVLWSADPFSVYAKADRVWSEGRLVYDRADARVWPVSDYELGRGGAQ